MLRTAFLVLGFAFALLNVDYASAQLSDDQSHGPGHGDVSSVNSKVLEVVCNRFVSEDEAHQLTARVLPELRNVVLTPTMSHCWSGAISTISILGTEDDFDLLEKFVLSAVRGPIDDDGFVAITTAAFTGTGVLVRRFPNSPRSRLAVEFLIESIDPANWESRVVTWNVPGRSPKSLRRVLAQSAVNGLVFSGSARAKAFLLSVQDDAGLKARLGKHLVSDALRVFDERKSKSLDEPLSNHNP